MVFFYILDILSLSFRFSQFEERFEEIGTELPSSLPSKATFNEKPPSTSAEDGNGKEIQMPGSDAHGLSPDYNSQDFVGRIMKIVPSDVDVSL